MTEATATQTQATAQTTAGTTQTGQTTTNGNAQAQQQASETLTFDKWLEGQPDEIKDLLGDHTAGLKSALETERSERKSLSAQLKALSKNTGDGDELKTKLDELSGKVEETDSRATFFEQAHEAGVKNLRLAYLAAKEFDIYSKRTGEWDFGKLKTLAPELFATNQKAPVPSGNAGSGAGQSGVASPSVNNVIRRMAGRQ
jgi:hypothetical protein